MTVWQGIVDAVEAAAVRVAPGAMWAMPDGSTWTCASSIPGGVSVWRRAAIPAGATPAVVIHDMSLRSDALVFGSDDWALTVYVTAYVASAAPMATVRQLTADLHASMTAAADGRWGGLSRYTTVEEVTPDAEQEGDVVAATRIRMEITYRTQRGRL